MMGQFIHRSETMTLNIDTVTLVQDVLWFDGSGVGFIDIVETTAKKSGEFLQIPEEDNYRHTIVIKCPVTLVVLNHHISFHFLHKEFLKRHSGILCYFLYFSNSAAKEFFLIPMKWVHQILNYWCH